MTFNIKNGRDDSGPHTWESRRDRVASMIRFHAPAIAGLQEVFVEQLRDLDGALEDYDWIGVGRDDGAEKGEFAPILFRCDLLELVESGHFWLSETPEKPGLPGWDAHCTRVATWGRFRVKAQPAVECLVMNTHLDHAGEIARREGARLLRHRLGKLADGRVPVILMGDFNARPDDEPWRIVVEDDPSLTLRDARLISQFPHHGATWSWAGFEDLINPDGHLIDFIFVGPGVKVRQHGVLSDNWNGLRPSDHQPVMAEIVIGEDH